MALTLKKAERKKAKLKLGMAAPSGGGKTLGALLIAFGMMKEKYPKLSDADLWAKIAIIDSENGSGELYANSEKAGVQIGEYCAITLAPPFTPEKYIEGITLCHQEGIEVCIIDSTTHLWAGQGGLLEQQGNAAKRTGNSYTAWRDVTPAHNKFIDTMLQTDIHIIATMRSKTEYVQEKDANGKTTVRKVGLNPVQRDGMEYEFTAFLEIDAEHNAFGSKDRTGIVDQQYVKITPDMGRRFMRWLESGVETTTPTKVIAEREVAEETPNDVDNLKSVIAEIDTIAKEKATKDKTKTFDEIKKFATDKNGKPTANYNAVKDINVAQQLLEALQNLEV